MFAGEDYGYGNTCNSICSHALFLILFAQKGKVKAMFTSFLQCFSSPNSILLWIQADLPRSEVKRLRDGVKCALIVTFLFKPQPPQQRVWRWVGRRAGRIFGITSSVTSRTENHGGPSPLNPTSCWKLFWESSCFRCAHPREQMSVNFKPKYWNV